MRISDWSSDVCSSDLVCEGGNRPRERQVADGRAVDFLLRIHRSNARKEVAERQHAFDGEVGQAEGRGDILDLAAFLDQADKAFPLRHFIGVEPRHVLDQRGFDGRSEEHTSELQSLMRISYTDFCLKKKKNYT